MKRLENELEWQTQWIKTMPKTKSLTMCISLAVSSICSLNMLLYIMYLFIYIFGPLANLKTNKLDSFSWWNFMYRQICYATKKLTDSVAIVLYFWVLRFVFLFLFLFRAVSFTFVSVFDFTKSSIKYMYYAKRLQYFWFHLIFFIV